jgi:hypothetical protein
MASVQKISPFLMFKMRKIVVADLDRAAAAWFTQTENERNLP